MNEINRSFDWNDEIEQENEFSIVPEGIYDFEVTKFERAEHPGSNKLPPCKKALLTIRVTDGSNATTIIHPLFLHSKCEGMLSAFFISIGQKKHGQKLRMNWTQVVGSKGKCKVVIEPYNGLDYNKIKSFLDPEKTASNAAAPKSSTAYSW